MERKSNALQDISDRRLTRPSNLKYKLAAIKETLNNILLIHWNVLGVARMYQKGDKYSIVYKLHKNTDFGSV